ncbi:MAG: hypothetical protein Q8N13_01500 [Acidovorax sp.]|nr:hypothetical protein [Acidovorax sp.]
MDRRLFVNFSSLFAATTLAGCGGGDSSQFTSEFTPETLEEFDASGPEIKREDLTDVQPKNTWQLPLVPPNSVYQVEVTYMTTLKVKILFPNLGLELGSKELTGGTNNVMGFALLKTGQSSLPQCIALFNNGTVGRLVTVDNMSNNVRYRTVDGEGIPCTEYAIYDPFMGSSSTSVAVYIRFYEIPANERPVMDASFICKVIQNNAKHQSGAGLTAMSLSMRPTSKSVPGYHALNIRSTTGDNHDTVMLPSSPLNHYNHYVLVPTLMGASDELKPYLARRMARHGFNLGKASAAVHGPLDHPTDDAPQFDMLMNDKMRMVWGTGGIIYINNMQGQISTAMRNEPADYTVGRDVTDFIKTFIGSYSTDALQQSLLDSVNNSMKSDNAGGAISAAVSLQAGASWQSDTVKRLWRIPVVPGGGGRFSVALGRAGAGFGGAQAGHNFYYFMKDGQIKLTFVLIIKLFNSAALKVAGYTFDTEVSFAVTIDTRTNEVRYDSVTIEPVIDYDKKTFLGWILNGLMQGVAWVGRLRVPSTNRIQPVITSAAGVEMAVITRGLSETLAALPALTGTVRAMPSFGGDALDPVQIVQQTAQAASGPFSLSPWMLGELSMKFVIVNTSIASGTFQKGWSAGHAFGFEVSWKDLFGYGLKFTQPFGPGNAGAFVRVMAAVEAHVAVGSPTYMASTQYQITI